MTVEYRYDRTDKRVFVNTSSDGFKETSELTNLLVLRRYDSADKRSSKLVNNRYSVALPYRRTVSHASFHPIKEYSEWTKYAKDPVTGQWRYVLAFTQRYYFPDNWTNLSRHYLSTKDPDPSNRALKRFYDKVMEFRTNMAMIFAERQKAIDMAAGRLKKLFEAYRDVRKGRFRSAARRLGVKKPRSKEVSGAWLELQYGWLPLVSDVYSLLNLAPIPFDRLKGRASEATRYTGWLGAEVGRKRWTEYGATVTVSDTGVAFANSIGLINPALVAWELVPFSFVLDWALPIGDHLNYLTARVGLTLSEGYVSNKVHSTIWYNHASGLRINAWEHNFTRGTLNNTTFPLPKLEFENPISPLHLANAAALGRQLRN